MIQHIVIVSDELQGLGGVQKYVHTLANNFFKLGFKVTLISRFHAQQPFEYQLSSGITTKIIFDRRLSDLLKQQAAQPSEAAKIQVEIDEVLAKGRKIFSSMIRTWDDSVAIISTQIGSLMDLFACGLDETGKNRPLIISQYHGTYEYAKKQSYFPLLKNLFPRADTSLFLTESDARNFTREGLVNSEFIPNGVTVDREKLTSWNDRRNTVVFLGRLSKEKSLHELLEAWSLIHRNFLDWSLEIYGSGPEENSVVSLIDKLELRPSVKYMGPTDDVNGILAKSKVHVMSSHREGFPIVLLEAAANATPSVIYNSGPSSQELVVNDVNGYVTNKNLPLELAKSLSSVLKDDALNERLSDGCTIVSDRYSMESVMKKWLKLLDIDQESLSAKITNVPPVEQKRMSDSEMIQPLQRFTLELPAPIKDVTLGLVLTSGTLSEKDLVLTIECLNPSGSTVSNKDLSLSYSSALGKSFAYAPALETNDRGVLAAIASEEAFSSINIQVLPWNRKRVYDDVSVSQLSAQFASSINGRLVYQTTMAKESNV